MSLGVFLLFIGSVFFTTNQNNRYHPFPAAGPRSGAGVGGDLSFTALPAARPTVPLSKSTTTTFTPTLTAQAALAVDDVSNVVLYTKNAEAVRPLASITKLMTALVLLDLPVSWTSTTIITQGDWDGESHLVNVGEKYALEDLWHVALIGSSNSAISALVRNSTVSSTQFVVLMNKKAEELHLASASFVEPTGLDSGNVANAVDTAALLKEALRRDKIFKALSTGEYYAKPLSEAKQRRIWSTDWLLTNWIPNTFKVENIVGKTGFINDSLYNFAVRLTDERGHSVRVVIMGAASNEARFTEARDVAEGVFERYLWPTDAGYDALVE
jgi:D-alanyl-D-alanine endopeptidase (penicillin-binding protein 7)